MVVAAKRFTAELQRVGTTGTMFQVPFDLQAAFGRKRPPVRVTVRDHTWRTTPGVYDGVGYVVVNRSVKKATGVDAGDRVRVVMELDTEPRQVTVPPDLRDALAADPAVREAFGAMRSPTSASTWSGSRRPSGSALGPAASPAPSTGCAPARASADPQRRADPGTAKSATTRSAPDRQRSTIAALGRSTASIHARAAASSP